MAYCRFQGVLQTGVVARMRGCFRPGLSQRPIHLVGAVDPIAVTEFTIMIASAKWVTL